jgi:hypothetical protein
MIVYYDLCHGAEIKLCSTCRRHVDFNREAATDPHQPFTTPQTSGERCMAWKPKPALNPPRANTGD